MKHLFCNGRTVFSFFSKTGLTTILILSAMLALAQPAKSPPPYATLTGLGTSFQANAITRKGKIAFGMDTKTTKAAYWSNGTVKDISIAPPESTITACNADGSIYFVQVAGQTYVFTSAPGFIPNSSIENLPGTSSSNVTLCDSSGYIFAGYCDTTPCIWLFDIPMQLPGTSATVLNAMSDDGSTIACDLSGNYQPYQTIINDNSVGSAPYQAPALFTLIDFSPNNTIPPTYNPDNHSAYEDIFCLTSDGSLGFGGAYALYVNTSPKKAPGVNPVGVADGFWPVAVTATTANEVGNLANFEVHSCSADGSVLVGQSVTPTYADDGQGHQTLSSFNVGNAEIAFGGQLHDLNAFLTANGAATGWTLTNVAPRSVSLDGTVIMGTGTDPNGHTENWIATITPTLVSLTPSVTTFMGGASSAATVGLNYPLPKDSTVTITSSNTAAIPNTSAFIPEGAIAGTFTLTSAAVSAQQSVTLTASLGTTKVSSTITVNPPQISAFNLAQTTLIGGAATTGTVQLQGPAGPGGMSIQIEPGAESPGESITASPNPVVIPAGKTNASFTVYTKPVASVLNESITVLPFGGATDTLTINPTPLSEFTTSAGAVAGGNPVTGAVRLTSPAAFGGDVVKLSSNTPGVTVPATVTIPAGYLTATFPITSAPTTAVEKVTFAANLGPSTVYAVLNIVPAGVAVVRVSPAPVLGGVSTKAAVYLNGEAPAAGLVVQLASSISAAQIPSSVTVAAFQTIGQVTVTTSPVSTPLTAVITAVSGSTRTDTTFVINPATFTSVAATPNPVVAGMTTSLTITMNGKAGPSGLVVTLTSSSANVVAPASVTIVAGATAASVTLTTLGVKTSTVVTITAAFGSATKSCAITLSP